MMIETDRLELEMETGTTYWDCFKKVNIRRTEISVMVFVIQVLSGIYLVGYAALFFQCEYSKLIDGFCANDCSGWSRYSEIILHERRLLGSWIRRMLHVLDSYLALWAKANLQPRTGLLNPHHVYHRYFGLCSKL